tara:strand:- start:131 stop:607 length:477 start_codon:yes stop_codon:yes gene_type:complete
MITEQVYISNQLETLTSFGVIVDTGEQVFINSRLIKKHRIQEGTTHTLVLALNPTSRDDCPWQAIGYHEEKATSRVVKAKLEDRISEFFNDLEHAEPHTAPAISEALDVDDTQMQLTLLRMHNAGEIAKAQVYSKGNQDKASFVLWAVNTSWFYDENV